MSIGVPFKVLDVGQGADLLVLLDRVVFFEVKNPNTSKVRQQLTNSEAEFQSECNLRGIPYFVVYTVQDVKDIIGRFKLYLSVFCTDNQTLERSV